MRRFGSGLPHGIRTALRNNLAAYGFSVMITATFGVLSASLGPPNVGDVFLFAGGAVTGVTLVDGITSRGFRERLRGEQSEVVALGAALGYFSVGLAIGAAALVSEVLEAGIGWAAGAAAAAVLYVLISGGEMTMAHIAQEDLERHRKRHG
jgi:hypothetical protein